MALLHQAQERGYHISATQLGRWHRAGLLPQPRQVPLRERRGSVTVYPTGTGEQLLLLCKLREHERRFPYLAWQLYLAGYPVELTHIRALLVQAGQRWMAWMAWFSDFQRMWQEQESSEDALAMLESYAERDGVLRPLRRVRKRVGRQHLPTFLRLLTELASTEGSVTGEWQDREEWLIDLRIFAQGLGMSRRYTRKHHELTYYLGQVLLPQVRWLFAHLQRISWEGLGEQTSRFELLKTRDELMTWIMRESMAHQQQEHLPAVYPRWDYRLATLFQSLAIPEQAMVLLAWLGLRRYSESWFLEMTWRVSPALLERLAQYPYGRSS